MHARIDSRLERRGHAARQIPFLKSLRRPGRQLPRVSGVVPDRRYLLVPGMGAGRPVGFQPVGSGVLPHGPSGPQELFASAHVGGDTTCQPGTTSPSASLEEDPMVGLSQGRIEGDLFGDLQWHALSIRHACSSALCPGGVACASWQRSDEQATLCLYIVCLVIKNRASARDFLGSKHIACSSKTMHDDETGVHAIHCCARPRSFVCISRRAALRRTDVSQTTSRHIYAQVAVLLDSSFPCCTAFF